MRIGHARPWQASRHRCPGRERGIVRGSGTRRSHRGAVVAAERSGAVDGVLQWWGSGPYGYYSPGYVYGGWGWNPGGAAPAPGYAAGYQAGAYDVARCVKRFRSYDPVSRTYLGRDRRRHPCP